DGEGRGIGNVQAELSAFLSWCVENDDLTGLEVNPILGMPKLAHAVKRKRWLEDHELKWVLVALHSGVANGFAAPFELILRTGQRRNEIMLLRRRNIMLDSNMGPHIWL